MDGEIKKIICMVFNCSPDEVGDDVSPDKLDNWDSLRHITLVSALEEKFEITFNDDEIEDLISFYKIKNYLKAHIQK